MRAACSRFRLIAILCLPIGSLAAQEPQVETEQAPPAVTQLPEASAALHAALQSREFERAVELLDGEIAKPDAKSVDYLLYLKGRALTELEEFADAEAVFEKIEADYPNSTWVSRSRFGRAHLNVLQQEYEAAGRIYQAEAERLLSRDRKDELAGIYLEFADRYFEGIPAEDPSQAKKPDYQQALTYYQEALKLGPTEALQERVEFRVANCFDRLNNGNEAIRTYRAFLLAYADDAEGDNPERQLRLAEVQYRLGLMLLKSGQRAQARKVWQDFVRQWAEGRTAGGDQRVSGQGDVRNRP